MKPDAAHQLTDKELATLERRIAAEYKKAAEELTDKINAYFDSFTKRDAKQKELIGTIVNTKSTPQRTISSGGWRRSGGGSGLRPCGTVWRSA